MRRVGAGVAAWGLLVTISGGFVIEYGAFRFSSRTGRNSFLIAIVAFIIGLVLTPDDGRRRLFARWLSTAQHVGDRVGRGLRPLVPAFAAAFAIGIAIFGIRMGAIDAGGSDVLGYVSQAELWLKGSLRVEQPLMRQVNWTFAGEALTPLGYKPGADGVSSVPAYSPGLPLMMAAFQWFGGRSAVYLVVPLLGGLLTWSAYKLGTNVGGAGVGLATAVLTATSPAMLFQLMLPMSDVPVAAWWALALWLLTIDRPRTALLAGLAAGLAVLTRPNHVFYVPIPFVYLAWQTLRTRSLRGVPAQQLAAFTLGVVPAILAVAAINTWVYGSPLTSGSGTLDQFYSLSTVLPNLRRYLAWMSESNTPVFVLALFAPFVIGMARRLNHRVAPQSVLVLLLIFGGSVFGSYFIFFVFEDWWYLRYVLAAFAPLFALTSLTIWTLLRRFVPHQAALAVMVIVAALAWHGAYYAKQRGAFAFRAGEQKYSAVGSYLTRKFPANAAFICMLYSGSVRYYSGHLTVRYDWIVPKELDKVIADLTRLGYAPYILLDADEEALFRERYAGASRLAALDWPPVAELLRATPTRIYNPSDANDSEARGRVPDVFR